MVYKLKSIFECYIKHILGIKNLKKQLNFLDLFLDHHTKRFLIKLKT